MRLLAGFCKIFLLWPALAGYGQVSLPVDKNASPPTIRLYDNLQKIVYKGFLFGHQDDLAYGVNWKYIPGNSDVREVTGDYPGLYGWELGRLELDSPRNIDGVPFALIKQWISQAYKRGAVITLSWHLNNPFTGKSAWNPAAGTMQAILPGGSSHQLYISWLNKVATFISSLKDDQGQPIPVIFRIFHELNGNWFWWGGINSSNEEMKQLYRFTVKYLRDNRQIHNIIYAYNTDRFSSSEAYLAKYPGNEWVDILGFDIYQREHDNAVFAAELDRTIGLLDSIAFANKKIPALTEFGYNGLPDSSWWTSVLLPVLKKHSLAYIMAWRNAGDKGQGNSEYYVPFRGQVSAKDFSKFYDDPATLFETQADSLKLYR